ncbi:hypothetical protein TREES_T100012857 [Tupaia chinensis]|uniref:Uncharacterized protein n=1 Tax=Tupaia chinensis TaxID=246437 RepID=L9LB50_TUPCH|nr:hypothetical protein TREES_T100012857 [Tupaia chinensis]
MTKALGLKGAPEHLEPPLVPRLGGKAAQAPSCGRLQRRHTLASVPALCATLTARRARALSASRTQPDSGSPVPPGRTSPNACLLAYFLRVSIQYGEHPAPPPQREMATCIQEPCSAFPSTPSAMSASRVEAGGQTPASALKPYRRSIR